MELTLSAVGVGLGVAGICVAVFALRRANTIARKQDEVLEKLHRYAFWASIRSMNWENLIANPDRKGELVPEDVDVADYVNSLEAISEARRREMAETIRTKLTEWGVPFP